MGEREELAALPDHEVMARLKGVGPESMVVGFEVLVGRYKNAIVSFLYRFVGDFRTAEDLAQETFLRVFRKVDTYNPEAKFSTWLYRLAIKWGWFGNVDPGLLRRRLKITKWFLTVFFTVLGLLTLAAYYQIGETLQGNPDLRYVQEHQP